MKKVFEKETIYKGIFEIVRHVPKGRVTTYGSVAKAMGLKSGARIVGHAMGEAGGVKPQVPVQRVVNSQGLLSGDGGYRRKKLEAEGVKVENGKVMDFKKIFWDPLQELDI